MGEPFEEPFNEGVNLYCIRTGDRYEKSPPITLTVKNILCFDFHSIDSFPVPAMGCCFLYTRLVRPKPAAVRPVAPVDEIRDRIVLWIRRHKAVYVGRIGCSFCRPCHARGFWWLIVNECDTVRCGPGALRSIGILEFRSN